MNHELLEKRKTGVDEGGMRSLSHNRSEEGSSWGMLAFASNWQQSWESLVHECTCTWWWWYSGGQLLAFSWASNWPYLEETIPSLVWTYIRFQRVDYNALCQHGLFVPLYNVTNRRERVCPGQKERSFKYSLKSLFLVSLLKTWLSQYKKCRISWKAGEEWLMWRMPLKIIAWWALCVIPHCCYVPKLPCLLWSEDKSLFVPSSLLLSWE